LSRLRRTFARITTQPFVKSILKFQPDAVICPHYLPLEILGGIKANGVVVLRRWWFAW